MVSHKNQGLKIWLIVCAVLLLLAIAGIVYMGFRLQSSYNLNGVYETKINSLTGEINTLKAENRNALATEQQKSLNDYAALSEKCSMLTGYCKEMATNLDYFMEITNNPRTSRVQESMEDALATIEELDLLLID